jgi:tRNA-specific 2-thiouridylase
VGDKEDTKSYGLIAKDLNFISIEFPKKSLFLKAKIRYNHREVESEISPLNNKKVKVVFKEAQFSVCPGQSVVFYDRDTVVGGGIIEKSLG